MNGNIAIHTMHVLRLPTQTALVIILLLAIPALLAGTPTQEVPAEIAERERYAEIVCSATILKISQADTPVMIEGEERSQWLAVATIDRVFKGTLDAKVVEVKYYGYIPPPGVGGDILTPSLAHFRPGSRYVLFLKRHGPDIEVAIPVYQMEIQLASRRPILDESSFEPYHALAKELIFTIFLAPDTIGRSATHYYSWTEELVGRHAIPLVELFLRSSYPLIRYQAAWWLSFREVNNAVITELKNAMQDESIEEWARSGARDRLLDMAAGRDLP